MQAHLQMALKQALLTIAEELAYLRAKMEPGNRMLDEEVIWIRIIVMFFVVCAGWALLRDIARSRPTAGTCQADPILERHARENPDELFRQRILEHVC